MDKVTLQDKGLNWFKSSHSWIYRDDVVEGNRSDLSGGVVAMQSRQGRFLGYGFYNHHSKIILRVLTRLDEKIDKKFWEGRIKLAQGYRKKVVSQTNAYRVIFSESDFLPGLIVDNYDNHLVMQCLALGMDNLKESISEILIDLFKPKSVILRNDMAVRSLEGLGEEKSVLYGKKPHFVEICEGGIKFLADLWDGHKTGLYLDQRENRINATKYGGENILDAFCYQGGFSLHLAKGAKRVIAVDSSKEALGILGKNCELNDISNVETICRNGFDVLKEYSKKGEVFDVVILDPPAFAPAKKDRLDAARGYKDLNLRAMKAVKEGGYLITSCCSYNISEWDFLDILAGAACDAGRQVHLVEKRTQAKDHPILLSTPETYYLKCLVLKIG